MSKCAVHTVHQMKPGGVCVKNTKLSIHPALCCRVRMKGLLLGIVPVAVGKKKILHHCERPLR